MPARKKHGSQPQAGRDSDELPPHDGQTLPENGPASDSLPPRPGQERDVTAVDLERARKASARIWELSNAKLSPGLIARAVGVPVAAVRAVLAESPQKIETPAVTSAAAPSAPTPPVIGSPSGPTSAPLDRAAAAAAIGALGMSTGTGQHGAFGPGALPRRDSGGWSPGGGYSAAPYVDPGLGMVRGDPMDTVLEGNFMVPSLYANLYAILREAGLSDSYSKGIVRGFSRRQPDDYAYLDALLSQSGAPAAARRLVVENYRGDNTSSLEPAMSNPDDPAAEIRRRRRQARVDRIEELDLARLEREAAGVAGNGAVSEEVLRLRGEVELLRKEREERRLGDLFDAKLAPIAKAVEEMRTKPPERRSTLDDVKVDGYSAAMTSLIRNADKRLAEGGTGQAVAKQLATSVTPKLVRVLGSMLDEGEVPGETDGQDVLAAYRVLSRSAVHVPHATPPPDVVPPPPRPRLEWSPPPTVPTTGRYT